MPASPCRISTSKDPSSPYPPPSPSSGHPLGALIGVAQDPQFSCESRLLYVILVLMAWTKGRCWPGIETQAGYLGRSEDSITRYHRELQARGLLLIDRSGKYNRYYPAILQGQAPRPTQQPHRMGAGHGGASTRTHAALTPKKTELKNVKNVGGIERPEWLDDYWNHLDQENAENVDKSWLKHEEQAPIPISSDEPTTRTDTESPETLYSSSVCDDSTSTTLAPVSALALPGDPDIPTPDTEQVQETSAFSQNHGDRLRMRAAHDTPVTNTEEPQYSSVVSDDRDDQERATGDPDIKAPDPEKVQYSSANPGNQARGEHFTRGKNISTPNPEKAQEIPAKCEDRGDRAEHGDRGDSPMRVRGPRSRKIFDASLLQEILDLTGDRKSLGCWISVVNQIPEEEVRIAMSSLRQAMAESDIYRPGGYMLGVLRARNPDFTFAGRGKKKNHGQDHDEHSVPPSTYAPDDQVPTTPPRPVVFTPPAPPEPPPPSIEDLVKGWRFAAGSLGIPRMLEIMKTAVGDALDPSALWSQVKDLCTGKDERTTFDRFLQVVTTRLKHAEMKQQLT